MTTSRLEFRLTDKLATAEADLERAGVELTAVAKVIRPETASMLAAAATRYAEVSARVILLRSLRGDLSARDSAGECVWKDAPERLGADLARQRLR